MKRNKALSLFLAVVMLIGLAVPMGTTASATTALPDMTGQLVVLHTNDTHGRDNYVDKTSLGTAAVLNAKKAYEAAGADVLLLSAGDAVQGAPLVNVSKGKTAIEFMNKAGYDAMTLGNHEFDYSFERLLELQELAEFPMLSASITKKSDDSFVFDQNKVFTTKSGKKVGVFGLTTPKTATSSHPLSVKDINFAQEQALYKIAQAQIDALKTQGCDFIIALGHLGTDPIEAPNRSFDVVKNTNGINLFVDGHSHTKYTNGYSVDNTIIVSTGCYLDAIGRVVVDKSGKINASLITDVNEFGQDEALKKIIDDEYKEIQNEYNKVFAKSEVDLNGTRAGGNALNPDGTIKATFPAGIGNRTAETNLGDLSADAQLYAAKQVSGLNIDLSLVNGGNIRETIAKGNVTKNDMITVFPYNNTLVVITVTGAQILEALEAACYSTPDSTASFPQVAGVEFTVDCSTPYEKGEKYEGTIYYAPKNPGSRIKDVKIGGRDLDLNASYNLVTNDFIATGGDTYAVFKEPYEKTGVDTGYRLEDAMILYITEQCKGVIGGSYSDSQGRIKRANLPKKTPAEFEDVPFSAWYYTAVSYVLGNGTMSGDGTSTFKANKAVTRAEFYQTLYNMEGNPAVEKKSSFTDVKDGDWFEKAVIWAEENELTDGTGDGKFSPKREITRQEMAKAFADYLKLSRELPTPDDLSSFDDANLVSSWAKEGMGICVKLGIMQGHNGKLNPRGNATRGEFAQILYNDSKNVNDKALFDFAA